MKLKIRQQLVRDTQYKNGKSNTRKGITIHETGNTQNGADAAAHANLQSNRNTRPAAWHWQVDDTEAVQSFDHSFQLWHAGAGNNNTIAIEICINRDGNYKKAVENAAALVRHIQQLEGISDSEIYQHYKWTGKNCPAGLRSGRDGINWTAFKKLVASEKTIQVPTSKIPRSYTGDSIVMYLKTVGIDSSYRNRERLAAENGIKGYRGTAAQNTSLLSKMREGSSKPSRLSVDAIAREVIAGKWGNGQERTRRLDAAGYNSVAVQNRVNSILRG